MYYYFLNIFCRFKVEDKVELDPGYEEIEDYLCAQPKLNPLHFVNFNGSIAPS